MKFILDLRLLRIDGKEQSVKGHIFRVLQKKKKNLIKNLWLHTGVYLNWKSYYSPNSNYCCGKQRKKKTKVVNCSWETSSLQH